MTEATPEQRLVTESRFESVPFNQIFQGAGMSGLMISFFSQRLSAIEYLTELYAFTQTPEAEQWSADNKANYDVGTQDGMDQYVIDLLAAVPNNIDATISPLGIFNTIAEDIASHQDWLGWLEEAVEDGGVAPFLPESMSWMGEPNNSREALELFYNWVGGSFGTVQPGTWYEHDNTRSMAQAIIDLEARVEALENP